MNIASLANSVDIDSFLTITPLMTAVLCGVVAYVVAVALMPKQMVFETKYTRNQIQRLAQQGMPAQNTLETNLLREQYKSTGLLARVFYTMPFAKTAHPSIVRAGLAASVNMLFFVGLGTFLIAMLLLKNQGLEGIVGALAIAYLVVWRVIHGRIKKRTAQFLGQFPDALDMIVRSVRSGFPLNAAVNMVADSMPTPVNEEFKQVSDEVSYGTTLVEALYRLSQRIKTPDVRFFAVVLTLQQDVGGNLAEVLENLADLIRKRKTLRLKIQALTSEGKATMWVLGLLPVFVCVVISFIAPDHLRPLYEMKAGQMVLGAAITLVVIGVTVVNKMVKMEV